MGFSDTQMRQLRAKLDGKCVKTRRANGATLHYVEGWHVLDEANRIFGFDGWDRQTLKIRCIWTGMREKQYATAYTAKVRIRVRAGDATIVREGSGTGEGRGATPGEAHEIGLKCAETDATKRALATFGNRFGLALYDPEQAGVRPKPDRIPDATAIGPWVLQDDKGQHLATHDKPEDYVEALKRTMAGAPDIEHLFAVWEQNLATVRILNRCLKQQGQDTSDVAQGLVGHLKTCAVALVPEPENEATGALNGRGVLEARVKIDKSTLAIAEVKRLRSKEHLQYVARQPCVICGRQPSHAHHVRFAQPKGVGLKVSDEFTVPLCAIHHQENHTVGNERRWWQDRKLDPLMVARKLWEESRKLDQPSEAVTT